MQVKERQDAGETRRTDILALSAFAKASADKQNDDGRRGQETPPYNGPAALLVR